jgi:hypothetical protein
VNIEAGKLVIPLSGICHSIEIVAQAHETRVPHHSASRDAAMGDVHQNAWHHSQAPSFLHERRSRYHPRPKESLELIHIAVGKAVLDPAGIGEFALLGPRDVQGLDTTSTTEPNHRHGLDHGAPAFQPVVRPSTPIWGVYPLRDDALEAKLAGLGIDLGAVILHRLDIRQRWCGGPLEKRPQDLLSLGPRQGPQVLAV